MDEIWAEHDPNSSTQPAEANFGSKRNDAEKVAEFLKLVSL